VFNLFFICYEAIMGPFVFTEAHDGFMVFNLFIDSFLIARNFKKNL